MLWLKAVDLWKNNWAPADVMRKSGYYPARKLARGFVARRMGLD